MLDNIEKNTEDQTDPFAKYGGKKVVKNEDPFSKYGGSILKKKESSQPTSQGNQSVSSAQQKKQLISAVTGQQPNQQASAGSNGQPKIGTFTGFTPEQQKSMKAKPAPDYMVKKPREKEIQKQTEVSKGELLIQSPPLGKETKSYYRVVADEKKAVENKIKNFEDKYLKAGIDIEQIKTDGTYQDLQKQKAQLDEEYRPVENALREVKKETTTFTRPIERLVSSFTDGKYTLANTETINLSKDVEDKLIDSFDKLPQEQKQKWAKGSLPTEAKEQLINTAKTEVLNEKYTSLKAEFSDYIKNVKDNPNISTEQKKLIQDQLKAKNDAFNAQVAIDFSGNTLKNNFKSTKQSKDLDEGILSKYEGFIPETLDAASTFIEGMGSVIAKGATGIPTLALLGAERFNQITGASNPDDYTPIEATLDLINDTTNYNFLPSSKSAEGNIVDEEGNLNLSYRSVTKTLANTLPFTLKIINDVKKGRIEGSPQSMISQLLNPKNNKQFRDQLISAETAYKITIGDNYKQAKDLGMTDANAFTYANVMSMAEGVSESIMPDIKFFDTVAGSSIKEAFKGNLKNAATKEAAKTVTKDFFKNIGGELGEEEFTLAVEDGLKYSMLLNHKNSEFFNLTKQKELAASTIILSGALGGVAIPNKLKESKKDIYRGVYNNIADIQDLFATEIKSPLTDKKTKESLYEAYKFASDVANAVAKAPETVTADQIDLLVQKNKLEEKKKNIDTAFHPDINKEIADIDTKIADMSKAKEVTAEVTAPVVEEIKTTEEVKPTDLAKEYIQSIEKVKSESPDVFWSVDRPFQKEDGTIDEVQLNKAAEDGRIIKTDAGFGVVGEDGDIKGVFKADLKSTEKTGDKVIQEAVKVGGTKLDNFALPNLMKIYERNGFREVSRLPFNEEYAPEGWNKEKNGTPDVVAMVYDPEAKLQIEKKDFTDYDEAIKYRDSFLENKAPIIEIDAELEAITKLFDESEQGGNVTDKKIDNGKKAIENIVPDVEWIIHDTNESMMDATGSTNKGSYIMTKDKDGNVKKVIHINKASADGTTVAHEVFHAVLLEKVLNDADAQDLTRRMMKAVSKTASPELKRELDEFARNYEDNIRDEEKLAQLIGILANNYDQLSQPNKTIINKWLDKLAKMFGLKPFTDNEVIDLLNTIAGKTAIGDVITEKDVDILNSGVSTYISEPVEIKKFQSKNEKKVKVGDHKLSFVKKSDIIDLNSLMKDISDKKQKVWFWVADQLGRGNYYDEVIDGEHYLDAGPSFALDPVNRDKNIIWATGKNEKEITKLIGNSDYIFIISGSPLKSKLFNKRIIDIVSKRAGDFDVFKKEVLDSSKIKSLNDILSSVNSWNELRDSTKRKEFLLELSNQQQKNTPLKKVLEKYNAIVDLNELRDGFYADNNFDLNDIMLVLKPTEYGGKSDHSTYENNILGDVVGVPDIKVNAFDIMPSELKDKYKEVLSKSQQQQAVAPYGIGVRTIERSQVGSNTIGDYVRIAKANNFSDEAIKKFLKSKGFSDTEIDTAMSARITSTGRPSVNNIYNQSKKAIEDRKKRASIKDLLPYLRKSLLDRQSYIKRLINKIDNKSAKKTYDLLVTKAGASALASERFKRAEKEIYGGLSSDDVNILDKMIYAKRIIAVNENRAKLGMEPYTGMDGYSMDDARQDLSDFKELLGADKYNDLSNRATSYFDVFKTNLKKLYDSGRISKEVYESLKDTEYSPIKTIKYIIGDNLTIDEIDTQAKSLGISRKDIMKLSDSNENEIILDSKWLLAMNISSVEGRAFENNMLREFDRAINDATPEEKKALEDFVLENPVVGTKKDGSPKYKYDDAKLPVGYVKVSYFDNGNKREIVIKDEYAKQLLDVKNKNKSLETLGALTGTKILRFFATGGNPLFIIGNTAVDFQNIAFFSDVYSKFKPLATVQLIRDYTKNFIKKIVVSNQYNKVFNEYINHGGALDYMASDGLRALESMNPIKGATKAAQKGLIAYGRAMAFLGETSEVAFRLSVYDKVKNDSIKEFKKENNREPNAQELDDIMWKAARESRETMDFSQGGDVAKNIDAVFPYFNAALQGIRRPIDFAKKDPVGFSSSVLQYTAMAASLAAGSFAMLIKAVRDDEDNDNEANKKILEALNSLSEYEKANYHVIFTGNKNKDGEYEYYRVKKLPVLSVISTVAEQLIYKEFFDSEGIEYDMDSEAMMEAVSKSNPLPVTVQEVAAKNPVASGLVSYWANKDTFTGDKIFREPNNKKIMPEAEGMFDDRVAQIYKDLAPGFGLSPARTQVMFEKVITSGNTNPTIPLIYSAYDGIFNNNDGLGSEVQAAMSSVGDAFGKKLVRHTDKNIIRYKKQDDMEYQESVIETDVWKSEQKVYDEIRSRYEDKNPLTTEELINIVEKNFDPVDHKKYAKKYNAYIQNMNVDKSVLDIIFEDVPEVQAMKLNQRYGPNLEDDELQELYEAMDGAGKKVNKKAIYIYNEKYNNRKD
jgi:hypothetical protein